MQRLKRFARYWDMIANSGRFKHTKPFLLGNHAFENFLALTNWLHAETDQTHNIALARLFRLLYKFMLYELKRDTEDTVEFLLKDYADSGIKGQPKFMLSKNSPPHPLSSDVRRSESRQKRHQVK